MAELDPRAEAIVSKIEKKQRGKAGDSGGSGWSALTIMVPWEFSAAVNKGAKRRNMSRAAYARRILALIVAYDLDIDWMDLLKDCPAPMEFGQRSYTKNVKPSDRDDGRGYGEWDILRRREPYSR